MTRKKFVIILIIIFIITVILLLLNTFFNYRNTKKKLEKRYKEEFVLKISNKVKLGDIINYYVYNNKDIIFNAYLDEDNLVDDYIVRITCNNLKEELSSKIDNNLEYKMSVNISEKIKEKNKNITFNELIDKYNIESILVNIVFNETDISNNKNIIQNAVSSLASKYNINVVVAIYNFKNSNYISCSKLFSKYPFVSVKNIENYKYLDKYELVNKKGKTTKFLRRVEDEKYNTIE